MDASGSVAAIILAAGSSSRMGGGRHKLLLPLAGRAVLTHVIDAALASQARPIILVLGHEAVVVHTQLATYADHPEIIIVENPAYLQGMSTSIHAGLRTLLSATSTQPSPAPVRRGAINDALAAHARIVGIGGALIMLGDQPLITAQIIDTLIETWHTTGKRIVAPLYEGTRGSPVLFATSLFGELLEITGDEGGRSVIQRHRQEVATVEMGNAMANYDVDTWEAYQHIAQNWEDTEGAE